MVVSFGIFPPEINSELMYTGPGAGSLFAAAQSWDGLAEELYDAYCGYQRIVTDLVTYYWSGQSCIHMVNAVRPYLIWMNLTAQAAAHTAHHIRQAAAAYELAHHGIVPPSAVARNRHELAHLIATNFFGQNIPAIVQNWSIYYHMWVQDALAMDTYADMASHSRELIPFQSPPPITTIDTPLSKTHPMVLTPLHQRSTAISHMSTSKKPSVSEQPHVVDQFFSTNSQAEIENFLSHPTNAQQDINIGLMAPMIATYASAFAARSVAALTSSLQASSAEMAIDTAVSPIMAYGPGYANNIGVLSVPTSWVSTVEAIDSGLDTRLVVTTSPSSSLLSIPDTTVSLTDMPLPSLSSRPRTKPSPSTQVIGHFEERPPIIPRVPAAG